MSDTEQNYQVEISSVPILELLSEAVREEDVQGLAVSSTDRTDFPITREVVERLINRLEDV